MRRLHRQPAKPSLFTGGHSSTQQIAIRLFMDLGDKNPDGIPVNRNRIVASRVLEAVTRHGKCTTHTEYITCAYTVSITQECVILTKKESGKKSLSTEWFHLL